MSGPTPSRASLVGRRDDLRRLAAAVGLDGDEPGGFVLLAGDAGVGKTRLLTELREQAVSAGWRVVVGHCLDFGDSALPYLPFSDAFGQLAAEPGGVGDALVSAGPAIARLLPSRRTLAGESTPEARIDRGDLFASVHAALTRLSDDAPVLLIVEDVHWADQSSRDLLSFLFSRTFVAPVAIVASYRSDDLHRRHPLRPALAEWGRLPGVTRQALDPLAEHDVRALVRELHAQPLPEGETSRIVARAEGNAFFVEELVAAVGPGALPADLADLLLVRVERLDESARAVVRAASAAGRQVSHALLAEVAEVGLDGVGPDALGDALRAAVEGNVLVAAGIGGDAGYAFRHALLGEAVYDDLLPGERVRIHRAYAAALARARGRESGAMGTTAAELARHARAAHDYATAVSASIRAGDEALAVGGPEEAARHFEVALELLEDADTDVDRVDLAIRAGKAAAEAGHLFRGLAIVADALHRASPETPAQARAALLLANAEIGLLGDTGVDALTLTTEALALVPEAATPERARVMLLHARALEDRSRDDQSAVWAGETQRLARELDLREVAVDAATVLARIERRAGDPEASLRALHASIAEARSAGEAGAELRSLFTLGGLHYERGDLAEARATYAAAADLAARTGRRWAPYGLDARALTAIVAQVQGDWDDARHIVDVRGESPPAMAEAMLAAVDLAVLAGRGDDRLEDLLEVTRPWCGRDGLIAILSGAATIESHAARGDSAAALAAYAETVSTVTTLWQRMAFLARIRLGAITIAALSGDVARGGTGRADLVARGYELVEAGHEAAKIWHGNRVPGTEGRAWLARLDAEQLRLRWVAGVDSPEAEVLVGSWRTALEAFEAFGHVHEIARSQARLAVALRAAGQATEAGALVTAARETAGRLGAQPLVAELRLVGGPGTTPRRAEPLDDGLTPREAEVLVLVAQGRTNREVATQLFISAKTVSVHVSNILTKLGAAGRTEAVAIARRKGVLRDDGSVAEG